VPEILSLPLAPSDRSHCTVMPNEGKTQTQESRVWVLVSLLPSTQPHLLVRPGLGNPSILSLFSVPDLNNKKSS
jgi:hypothetical protein